LISSGNDAVFRFYTFKRMVKKSLTGRQKNKQKMEIKPEERRNLNKKKERGGRPDKKH